MDIHESIIDQNRQRFISQTTHIICAKCGGDTPISNRELLPIKTEFVTDKIVRIFFPCPKCDETYDLGLSVLSGQEFVLK
jgi:Zn finger protein HypA/HybF involved in hydrogenase expression